jgi:hypothetical protein
MAKRKLSKKTGRFIRSKGRTHRRKSHGRKSHRARARKVWRKSLHQKETWKKRGKVRVIRNSKGRFVTWRKVRHYARGKKATTRWREAPTRIRARKEKKGGGTQVSAYGTADGQSKRVQMNGSPQTLYQAMMLVVKHPPKKQFLTISAEALLDDPYKYLEKKEWSRPRIES